MAFVLDESHRSDLLIAQEKWFYSASLGLATPLVLGEQLAPMLASAIRSLQRIPRCTIPGVTIVGVDCVQSQDSIYLQAADLLSNLAYNYLLYLKGVSTRIVKMKHELLSTVLVGGELPGRILDALEVVDEGQPGKHDYKLVVTGAFVGRMSLRPEQTCDTNLQ